MSLLFTKSKDTPQKISAHMRELYKSKHQSIHNAYTHESNKRFEILKINNEPLTWFGDDSRLNFRCVLIKMLEALVFSMEAWMVHKINCIQWRNQRKKCLSFMNWICIAATAAFCYIGFNFFNTRFFTVNISIHIGLNTAVACYGSSGKIFAHVLSVCQMGNSSNLFSLDFSRFFFCILFYFMRTMSNQPCSDINCSIRNVCIWFRPPEE